MRRMFVGNLPADTSEDDLRSLFSAHGTVRSVELAREVFSGKCRGFGFVEMEGHEARVAMAELDGRDFRGKPLRVNEEKKRGKGGGRRRGRR